MFVCYVCLCILYGVSEDPFVHSFNACMLKTSCMLGGKIQSLLLNNSQSRVVRGMCIKVSYLGVSVCLGVYDRNVPHYVCASVYCLCAISVQLFLGKAPRC